MSYLKCLIVFSIVLVCCFSCVYDDLQQPAQNESDSLLFVELSEAGYSYFQGGKTLTPAAASPHGDYRLRFNQIAFSALDASGRLPLTSSFPEGSILVKEVYTGSVISIVAVMKKSSTDKNASSGWLWAELSPQGNAYFSVKNRGAGCVSCHDDAPNRNLVRSFDLH